MIVVGRACFMAPRDPADQRQQCGAAEPRPLRQRECLFRRSNGGGFEQYIKEGKNAIKWTRLSCRRFAANAVRLQLHVLAYNLGNFMRTLAMPKMAEPWSPTSLREKLIKIGAKVVSHGHKWPRSRCRGRCSQTSSRLATSYAV